MELNVGYGCYWMGKWMVAILSAEITKLYRVRIYYPYPSGSVQIRDQNERNFPFAYLGIS